jgi:hypothetical protein
MFCIKVIRLNLSCKTTKHLAPMHKFSDLDTASDKMEILPLKLKASNNFIAKEVNEFREMTL